MGSKRRPSKVERKKSFPPKTEKDTLKQQIYSILKAKILNADYKPGQQIPTNSELAKIYGVSKRTAQLAVDKLGTDGYIQKWKARGSFVMNGIRTDEPMNNGKKEVSIGYILNKLQSAPDNPFFSRVKHGAILAAHEAKIIIYDELVDELNYSIPAMIRDQNVNGVLLSDVTRSRFPQFYRDLALSHLPYALIEMESGKKEYAVMLDNDQGTYFAAKHIYEMGHRNIGFINGPPDFISYKERDLSFSKHLRNFGLRFNPDYHFELWGTWKNGLYLGSSIDTRNLPTIFFIAFEGITLGFIEGLKKRGIKIPDDVSIITFDDFLNESETSYRMTSVHVPAEKIGETAFQFMVEIVEGRKNVEHIRRIPVTFMERNTVKKIVS